MLLLLRKDATWLNLGFFLAVLNMLFMFVLLLSKCFMLLSRGVLLLLCCSPAASLLVAHSHDVQARAKCS